MPLEEIVKLLTVRIFVPFRIHVSDGTHHDVMHPSQCFPLARSIHVGVPSKHLQPPAWATYVNIALIHIAKLEPLQGASAPSGNGDTPA